MTAPTIVSSQIILNNPQSDGRIVVIEQFADDQGNTYQQSYMAGKNVDVNAKLVADALNLQNLLVAQPTLLQNAQAAVINLQQQLIAEQAIVTQLQTAQNVQADQSVQVG